MVRDSSPAGQRAICRFIPFADIFNIIFPIFENCNPFTQSFSGFFRPRFVNASTRFFFVPPVHLSARVPRASAVLTKFCGAFFAFLVGKKRRFDKKSLSSPEGKERRSLNPAFAGGFSAGASLKFTLFSNQMIFMMNSLGIASFLGDLWALRAGERWGYRAGELA